MLTAHNSKNSRRDSRSASFHPDLIRQVALLLAVALFAFISVGVNSADAETRTLRMYFTHTKESAKITFKKNGRYVKSGLRKANRFLRDHRRKEPTKMDPALLDLVWEVYQKSGSRKPIHVISGYRSPRTNSMLRRRGRKVARKSQHTRGKALDFFMPDVSVKKLRALGLKAHRGGVGYYRGSFVHLDTGRVRHWPRMSRRQLARVFPRGKTIHVPSNGRPLKGYKTAMANLKRGRNANGGKRNSTVRKGLLARLLTRSGNDGDENEAASSAVVKKAPKPKRKPVAKPVLVAAKPKAPVRKKPSGPDPFSLENKAAKSTKQKQEEERKLKEAEDAKTIALAEAQAAEIKAAEEATQLAALVPSRVSVPRRRPSLRGANTLLALAPAADENQLTPVAATELALATPPAVTQVLRPSVDVPGATVPSQPVRQASLSQQDVGALNDRTKMLLARGRLVPVPNVEPVQPDVQNVNLPFPTAAPKRELPTVVASLQPAHDVTSVFESRLKPATNELPIASLAPTQKPALQPVVEASLRTGEPTADALEATRKPLPKTRPAASEIKKASVPVPAKAKKLKPVATAVATGAAPEPQIKLELGDLDGRSVKKWAVAQSTRVGPIATLQAPVYRNGTNRAAPSSVYSVGFAFDRSPLRADRFTGRALTRVAFAHFNRN